MIRKMSVGLVVVMVTANFAVAAVNVDVNTPNVRVNVGDPTPPPRTRIIERERVVVKEHDRRRDNGKHKGHYKKHKKHNKHDQY